MSLSDLGSSCSTNYRVENDRNNVIYNNSHLVDVFYGSKSCTQKNVSFIISQLANAIKLKVRDASDYSFNYTTVIDWTAFDRMRHEQLLDITFDEFQPQILDLLNQITKKQMQIRLEANDSQCKLIFYEKSRLKSLIFLTVDLSLTNQRELVEEMTNSISQLKGFNKSVNAQLSLTKNQLFETESLLKAAVNKNNVLEKQFYKDLELILQTFLSRIRHTETNISVELSKLTKRHHRLLVNLELLKKENVIKNDARNQLLQSVQNLRIDNERSHRSVTELKHEIDILRIGKLKLEDNCKDLRSCLATKEADVETLQKQMGELRRDLQDATMIITQKTKTNDEIGKDLLEANRLLVNFNAQYDTLANEADQIREMLTCKDDAIRVQAAELEKIGQEFANYRGLYNSDEISKLRTDLRLAKQRTDELEKQNREAIKLNGLLTKKLSTGEYEVRNANAGLSRKS